MEHARRGGRWTSAPGVGGCTAWVLIRNLQANSESEGNCLGSPAVGNAVAGLPKAVDEVRRAHTGSGGGPLRPDRAEEQDIAAGPALATGGQAGF